MADISIAVFCNSNFICGPVNDSPLKYFFFASINNAATAAACGAAAEVPKKLGNASLSMFTPPKSTVVFTPLGAQMSGLFLDKLFIKTPPLEENEATDGGLPNAGVFVYNTAPTVIAPTALAWPITVPVPWLLSVIVPSPLKIIYLKRTFPVLFLRITISFAFTFALTSNGNISSGSPPRLFLLNPNK